MKSDVVDNLSDAERRQTSLALECIFFEITADFPRCRISCERRPVKLHCDRMSTCGGHNAPDVNLWHLQEVYYPPFQKPLQCQSTVHLQVFVQPSEGFGDEMESSTQADQCVGLA